MGRFPSLGADWRTDVRIQETGDPTDPVYREWTHKEIWDLITLNGRNADPRDVRLFVLNPKEIAGAPGCTGGAALCEQRLGADAQRLGAPAVSAAAAAGCVLRPALPCPHTPLRPAPPTPQTRRRRALSTTPTPRSGLKRRGG